MTTTAPRRRRDLQPVLRTLSRRYSRFVGLAKYGLIVAAGALVLLILAWPRINGDTDGVRLSFADLRPDAEGNVGVTRARFAGTDGANRPFLVTAERAIPESARFETFQLRTLQADLTLSDEGWISVSADRGTFERGARMLELGGDIAIFSDLGYEFHASQATVDLAAGTVVSSAPVEGHGPLGAVWADAMRFRSDEKSVQFTGVRVVLNQGGGG